MVKQPSTSTVKIEGSTDCARQLKQVEKRHADDNTLLDC